MKLPIARTVLAGLVTAFALSSPIAASEPIGKIGLENIASIGASRTQAERGLAGRDFQTIEGRDGVVMLIADELTVGLCGSVYTVSRHLGKESSDGLAAVLYISSLVGPPIAETTDVVGGASGLTFSWPALADYSVTIIKNEHGWNASEAIIRLSICR